MVAAANMVEVAALVGDTARATILAALMGGQALTSSELAFLARISRPTASEHLSKLVQARLITVTKKRRYRYYRIASPLVAGMLESIKAVAAIEVPPRHQPRSARDDALRFARICYDHVACRLRGRDRGCARRRCSRRPRHSDCGTPDQLVGAMLASLASLIVAARSSRKNFSHCSIVMGISSTPSFANFS